MKSCKFGIVVISLVCGGQLAHAQWVHWAGNDHWYKAVRDSAGISWTDAEQSAESQGGYLSTIGGSEEDSFVFSLITDDMWEYGVDGKKWLGSWLGGLKDGDTWKWVTNESWSYSNWGPGQPDNNGGNETKLDWWFSGATYGWNDFSDPLNADDYGRVRSYIIERNTEPVPEPVTCGVLATGLVWSVRRRASSVGATRNAK